MLSTHSIVHYIVKPHCHLQLQSMPLSDHVDLSGYLQDSNNNNMNMALELFALHPIARTVWKSQSKKVIKNHSNLKR